MHNPRESENHTKFDRAVEKIASQSLVVGAATGDNRPLEQRLLNEMRLNRAALELNDALLAYESDPA